MGTYYTFYVCNSKKLRKKKFSLKFCKKFEPEGNSKSKTRLWAFSYLAKICESSELYKKGLGEFKIEVLGIKDTISAWHEPRFILLKKIDLKKLEKYVSKELKRYFGDWISFYKKEGKGEKIKVENEIFSIEKDELKRFIDFLKENIQKKYDLLIATYS